MLDKKYHKTQTSTKKANSFDAPSSNLTSEQKEIILNDLLEDVEDSCYINNELDFIRRFDVDFTELKNHEL